MPTREKKNDVPLCSARNHGLGTFVLPHDILFSMAL
jgi:hypothetical protein